MNRLVSGNGATALALCHLHCLEKAGESDKAFKEGRRMSFYVLGAGTRTARTPPAPVSARTNTDTLVRRGT
jgi:hypothetical protein